MTPLEKLKALSDDFINEFAKGARGNPREPLDSLGWDMALLSRELLALWEAAVKWEDVPYYFDDQRQEDAHNRLESAINALNARADEVIRD